eukprot:jgi/Botrbrau1/5401/Bobra.182_1s0005.1
MAVVTPLYRRPADLITVIFLVLHIPITIFIDSQSVVPSSWYPELPKQVINSYLSKFKDPLLVIPPEPWFGSLVYLELTFQLPFFLLGIYGFAFGKKWIQKPAIVYGISTATTVVPCLAQIWLAPGPQARIPLTLFYLPYLLMPLAIAIRMLMTDDPFPKQPSPPKRKRR